MLRIVLKGTPASPGMAIGRALVLRTTRTPAPARPKLSIPEEISRFETAVARSVAQLQDILNRTLPDEHMALLEAQLLFFDDPMFAGEIRRSILEDGVAAEAAVELTAAQLTRVLTESANPVFRERAADVADVAERLENNLSVGVSDQAFLSRIKPDSILIARDIAPSFFLQCPRLLGLVTEKGGVTAHVSLLARDRGIPALVGVEGVLEQIHDGDEVFVDARSGVLVVPPDEQEKKALQNDRGREKQIVESPVVLKDGTPLNVWANMDMTSDVADERFQRLQGIGLFRSEYLYMGDPAVFTDKARHVEVFRSILRGCAGKKTTFRLLDLGDDKAVPDGLIHLFPERGLRGIDLLLSAPEVLKLQLSAILDAAAHEKAECRILLPMVSRVDDLEAFHKILDGVIAESSHRRKPEVGMMLETPAACLMADVLSRYVQFMSIGTNDLAASVLSRDRFRQLGDSQFYEPAVFRLIELALGRAGVPVAVCGEMAARPDTLPLLVGLGVREVSVPLSALSGAAQLREKTLDECARLALRVLESTSASEVRAILNMVRS